MPGNPTTVTLEFPDTGRISSFSASVGSRSADGSCSRTTCTATVPTSLSSIGDISVDYDVAARSFESITELPVVTQAEQRRSLTMPIARTVFGEPNPDGSMPMTIPGLFDGTVTASEQGPGVPIYDPVLEVSGPTAHLAFSVPQEWLGEHGSSAITPEMLGESLQLRSTFAAAAVPLSVPEKLVTRLDIVFKAKDVTSLLKSGWDAVIQADKWEKLDALERYTREGIDCNPQLLEQALVEISDARQQLGVRSVIGGLFTATTLAVPAEWAESKLASLTIDVGISESFDLFNNWASTR